MFLKPSRPDLIVRHPDTKRKMKVEGEKVKPSTYWRRRLKAGDVIEVKSSGALKAPAKTKKEGGLK